MIRTTPLPTFDAFVNTLRAEGWKVLPTIGEWEVYRLLTHGGDFRIVYKNSSNKWKLDATLAARYQTWKEARRDPA